MARKLDSIVVPRISLEEAKAGFDSGSAVFVDVRAPEPYARARVPGAISLPVRRLLSGLNGLPRAAQVIFY